MVVPRNKLGHLKLHHCEMNDSHSSIFTAALKAK